MDGIKVEIIIYKQLLGILGLIMLVYFILKHKQLKSRKVAFPMYIYIAMFPYNINYLIPHFDILLKVIVFIGIIQLVYYTKPFKVNRYELVFMLIILITTIVNTYLNNNYFDFSALLNLMWVLVFSFYALNAIKNSRHLNEVLRTFTVNAIILSICTIIEYFFIGITRPSVSLGNPNYLALYILISIITLLYSNKKNIIIKLSILLLYIASLIIIKSSTIFLIMFIQILFWIITKFHSKNLNYFFGLAIGGIAIFYVITLVTYAEKEVKGIIDIFIKEDLSRIYIWRKAINIIKGNILWGIGYGNLLIKYSENAAKAVTHNDYIRIMGETGILGITTIIIYIIRQYTRIFNYKNKGILFLGATFITIIVFSLTHNNINSILFWFFLALPMNKNIF